MTKSDFVTFVQETNLEVIARNIITEMGLRITQSNDWLETPYSIHSNRPDFIVDDVLVIECQGHKHKTTRNAKKDKAKRNRYEGMGLGVLCLWEKELKKVAQKKAGEIWRPILKGWIKEALLIAHERRRQWLRYKHLTNDLHPWGHYPGLEGKIQLKTRHGK